MKKTIFLFFAFVVATSCGSKTSDATPDAESTVTNEVPDTLNNVEAVVKQVNAVYDYWNKMRENPKEEMPSVDERFGSKEWWEIRQEVAAIDRECECGGFFDFGEEGPLDPWTYDCYEGYVSANDIQVKLQEKGTAEVKFLVKDAVTTKGIPMRWLMRVEDGQWRVANVIFVNDDDYDILMNMRAYADDGKFNKNFDINKYLPKMKELAAEKQDLAKDEVSFNAYGLLDVDRDGTPEVFIQDEDHYYKMLFSIAGGQPAVLASSSGATEIYFYENGVGVQGGCGTGCMMSDFTIVKNSKAVVNFRSIDQYDMEGELTENNKSKDGKDITDKEYDKLCSQLGKEVNLSAMLHHFD